MPSYPYSFAAVRESAIDKLLALCAMQVLYPQPAEVADLARNQRRSSQCLLSRRELVAEHAARCALHDSLVTGETDFAAAGRGNVEIGLAYQ